MKKVSELGICPNCDCSVTIFKTSNYKRFAKCEMCGISYKISKRGTLINSTMICPRNEPPILIVDKHQRQRACFWTEQPFSNCVSYDICKKVDDRVNEFKELGIHGY